MEITMDEGWISGTMGKEKGKVISMRGEIRDWIDVGFFLFSPDGGEPMLHGKMENAEVRYHRL